MQHPSLNMKVRRGPNKNSNKLVIARFVHVFREASFTITCTIVPIWHTVPDKHLHRCSCGLAKYADGIDEPYVD
jgi:hypothetical protein